MRPEPTFAEAMAVVRDRCLQGDLTRTSVFALLGHVDKIVAKLDELDDEDTFGSEGWRFCILGED